MVSWAKLKAQKARIKAGVKNKGLDENRFILNGNRNVMDPKSDPGKIHFPENLR